MERRLAAILAADVVGYSRLMGDDEAGTLAAIKSHRKELIDPKAVQYHGRTIKLMGDGVLMEFPSVVDAVAFAVEVQCAMREKNASVPENQHIVYRIGINIGDIIVEGNDIYGDGVNVAARLEALADPGGICISRPVHTQIADKLDLDFEDLGEQEVKNIAKPVRVFRVVLDEKATALVTPVVEPAAKPSRLRLMVAAAAVCLLLAVGGLIWWQPWTTDIAPARAEKMAFSLPGKPSIAVLAFDNLSKDPKEETLSDAISENIITGLSRFPELFVIARNSSFFYKGKPVQIRQVAEELGVRYVIEGSLQRERDKLRVSVQLIDALAGTHVWAEQYDREVEDIFAIQDDITSTVVATVVETLDLRERDRAARKHPANLAAFEYWLRGTKLWFLWTKEGNEQARQMYEKALALDPELSEGYRGLAWVYINGHKRGWTNLSREEALTRAREMAQKAVDLAPLDYNTHNAMGYVHLQGGAQDAALAEYKKALKLNPNADIVLVNTAEIFGYRGKEKAKEAIALMAKAMRLNPHHPDWYYWNLAFFQYYAGQYEVALATMQKMSTMPNLARRTLAAIYVRLGRLADAQAVIKTLLENSPDYTLENVRLNFKDKFKNPADLEQYVEDLRKAGLPE